MAYDALPVKATRIYHYKERTAAGRIVEVVIYQVPLSPRNLTGYRFRCFMVDEATGKQLLGYDNHWPKEPHRHVRGHEEPYTFVSVEALLHDFFHAVDLVEEGKL